MSAHDVNPWIPHRKPKPSSSVRLFCFPFAGGGASIYREWHAALGPRIEVFPVQLPGREERLREPPETSMRALASRLADALSPLLRGRFAFFGHSMGALIQYELARELFRRGEPLPFLLMPSARRAPHLVFQSEPISDLSDKDFVEKLVERYQAIPSSVLAEPELMALFIPALRADFRMLDTYRHESAAPVPVPISAFAGASDSGETARLTWKWRELTQRAFRLDVIEGGHFFVSEPRARASLLPAVEAAISRALSGDDITRTVSA